MSKEKFFLRLTAIWLATVVLSMAIGLTASMTGHNQLSTIMGVIFISLFGGAVVLVILLVAIGLWLFSNEAS